MIILLIINCFNIYFYVRYGGVLAFMYHSSLPVCFKEKYNSGE